MSGENHNSAAAEEEPDWEGMFDSLTPEEYDWDGDMIELYREIKNIKNIPAPVEAEAIGDKAPEQGSLSGGKRSSPESEIEDGEAAAAKKNKRKPWTIQEHTKFLQGINMHGWGWWKEISKNVLTSRSPSQIASHAQKFVKRGRADPRNKKRCSIHDIVSVEQALAHHPTTTSSNPSSSQRSTPSFSFNPNSFQRPTTSYSFNPSYSFQRPTTSYSFNPPLPHAYFNPSTQTQTFSTHPPTPIMDTPFLNGNAYTTQPSFMNGNPSTSSSNYMNHLNSFTDMPITSNDMSASGPSNMFAPKPKPKPKPHIYWSSKSEYPPAPPPDA